MFKIFLFFILFFLFSCNNKDKKEAKPELKIKTKTQIRPKSSPEYLNYIKSIKKIYRKKRKYRSFSNKYQNFNKIFKNINKHTVTIGFYINFENFSSIPEPYKDKVKNPKHIFNILGIYLGKGYILSELSLMKKADTIFIKENNTIIYAELTGYDESYKIALLKVKEYKSINKIPVKLKNLKDSELMEGDLIFSLFYTENGNTAFRKSFVNFIHYSKFYDVTDAVYSQALSSTEYAGGVVFDSNGDFLGLTSLYDPYYDNSNYIIAVQIIKKILPNLKKEYKIEVHPWLGIYVKKSSDKIFVKKVIKDSPAEKAGIRKGDIILKINNKKILSKKDIRKLLSFCSPGNIIKIEISRNKKIININPKLTDEPLNYLYKKQNKKLNKHDENLGLILKEEKKGLKITEVKEGSPAFFNNLKTGDIILELADKKIKTIKDFKDELNKIKNQKIKIKYLRGKEVKLSIIRKKTN